MEQGGLQLLECLHRKLRPTNQRDEQVLRGSPHSDNCQHLPYFPSLLSYSGHSKQWQVTH
jgi:hypothetical protein